MDCVPVTNVHGQEMRAKEGKTKTKDELTLTPCTDKLIDISKAGPSTSSAHTTSASDVIEALQSKVRELEKKAELQNVRHEELYLEMAAIKCSSSIGSGRSPIKTVDETNSSDPLVNATFTNERLDDPRLNAYSPDSQRIPCSPGYPGTSNSNVNIALGQDMYPESLCSVDTGIQRGSYYDSISKPGGSVVVCPLMNVSKVPQSNCLTSGKCPISTSPYHTSSLTASKLTSRIMPELPTKPDIYVDLSKLYGHHLDHNLTADYNVVDMLDIPGKGRCQVYIAKYSYDPFSQSPNECPESELVIKAGDYILVWGYTDEDGFLDGELLDGRKGLIPSNYCQKIVGDDLLEFQRAVILSLKDSDDSCITNVPYDICHPIHTNADKYFDDQRLAIHSTVADDLDPAGDTVPPPKQLTLERQLNKCVLIGWNHPDSSASPPIDSYHVYVDGILKVTVKSTERTRALVEGVDANRCHRISVRSVTMNRRTSRDAACTMVIGKDAPLGPTNVRATDITATSAVITWLPSNSNFQHTVSVNNVEIRTVKPGVYRHTITGLAPNTIYRVTVKAKNIRSPQYDDKSLTNDRLESFTEFQTLHKGVPEPPSDIQLESGPQDGTILVTWQPVPNNLGGGNMVTGYAVYVDGKKVTDVESPSGDHALIDLKKIMSMNPRQITIRTKCQENQSTDSVPLQIPLHLIKSKSHQKHVDSKRSRSILSSTGNKVHSRSGQLIIDTDENLSDKEVYPNNIPSIEITKESGHGRMFSDEENENGYGMRAHARNGYKVKATPHIPPNKYRDKRDMHPMDRRVDMRSQNEKNLHRSQYGAKAASSKMGGPSRDFRVRHFIALFDYDPRTMSPNTDACEELAFNEGDSIKIFGEKDADGFYWGEINGRRGFVPHNMVMEVQPPDGGGMSNNMKGKPRGGDRWGDIYASMPMKKMVALYDYDPHELSPNVDAEVELSFRTGDIVYVFGEMDDDGFYMGEINGNRGLVPSNFLTEATDELSFPDVDMPPSHRRPADKHHGPGLKGPPLPPRSDQDRVSDACPAYTQEHREDGRHDMDLPSSRTAKQDTKHSKYKVPVNPTTTTTTTNAQEEPPPTSKTNFFNSARMNINTNDIPVPNIMQKLSEITVGENSVDNILSKGKELIFMKFGLSK